jgi:hypothetical protein
MFNQFNMFNKAFPFANFLNFISLTKQTKKESTGTSLKEQNTQLQTNYQELIKQS